jgi:hypothetical protein
MGYAWKGICHPTTTAALDQFKEDVPSIDAVGLTAFTAQPTISGTGLITWSISHRPLTGTAATTRTGTTQLQTCTTESMDQWPVQSLLLIVALFFAGFLGFKTGYRT